MVMGKNTTTTTANSFKRAPGGSPDAVSDANKEEGELSDGGPPQDSTGPASSLS